MVNEWKEFVIGESGQLIRSSINPQQTPTQLFTEYSMPAFDNGKKAELTYGYTMHSNRTSITDDILLYNKLNVRKRRVWRINKAGLNPVCSGEFLPYKSNVIDLDLLNQILLSDNATKYFEERSTGTSNSQKRITPSVFLNYKVCLPESITSQHKIAEILTDIDALIADTEKLIEKKKAIKQGVMQELLTGRRRLPGFSGEWRECTLDQMGSFRKGASISRDESQTGDIPAVRYGELYTVHNDYIKEYTSHISQDIADKSVKVKKNDILFTASGETKEDIGKCAAIVDDFTVYAGGDLIIFTPSIEISPVFFGTRLNHSDASKYKSLNGQGDSVVHISATVLGKMLISYPTDIKEQEAISSVIYDMDKEIETLTEQLQKYKNIKTGMMSKLLTGEIRLAE